MCERLFCLGKSKIFFQFILSVVQRAFLRILSMNKTTSCTYSVGKRRRPAQTQYEKDDVLRILSMKKMTFCVYSVWFRMMVVTIEITIFHHPLSGPIYNQYEKDDILHMLSMKKMTSCVYSV